jgi:FkbM family methyltransferase
MGADLFKSAIRATVPRPLRNWLRSPSKSAQWLWDAGRFYLGSTETLHFPPNESLICHPHAHRVAYKAQIADPEQREEFQNFVLHCSPSMFLFDIGAHFGVFSLAAAHFGGKAVAIDPSPIAVRMIARQSTLNRLTDNIRIIQAAVSNEDGAAEMLNSGVFGDGYFKTTQGRAKSELTRTQAITIDRIVSKYGAPTHIKIDVEGQEAAVLRGGRKAIDQYSPILFLELHTEMITSEGGDPNLALNELTQLGYEIFALNGNSIERDTILREPLIRIVAARATESWLASRRLSTSPIRAT